MPRGRKKKFKLKFNIKPETLRSILALVFFLFALVSLISFFMPDYAINAKLQKLMRFGFGNVSILLPPLFLLAATFFIDAIKTKLKEPRLLIGGVLLTWALAGFFHLFIPIKDMADAAAEGNGGGMLGYKTAELLSQSISIYGAFVLLLVLLVTSLIILFDVSLDQIVAFISDRMESLNISLPSFKHHVVQDQSEPNTTISTGFVSVEDDMPASMVSNSYSNYSKPLSKEPLEPEIEILPPPSEPEDKHMLNLRQDSTMSIAPSASVKPEFKFTNKIWTPPSPELLIEPPAEIVDAGDTDQRARTIRETLRNFGIEVDIDPSDIKVGSSVTQFALKPRNTAKVSKITSLQENLALALASPTGSVRIEAPIPGRSLIGIEVPNNSRSVVYFKSLLLSDQMRSVKNKLAIALGKDVGGRAYMYDIAKMPHLLIAGSTGSGKSVFIHNILFSILFKASPNEVKLILIDPKRNELILYNDIPHLITPVVTDMDKAPSAFKWAVSEMERRYKLFEQAKARNIDAYNEKSGFQALPYIVIIVDELAEIMIRDPANVEKSIIRLGQLARAAGIHLVLAVQRPSTDVITGLIKANIPCRVAFNVTSNTDSRVIIDQPGAEKLLGRGDMLFVPPDAQKPIRLQGAMISDKEINNLVNYLKAQDVAPEYKEEILNMATEKSGGRGGNVNSHWGADVDDDQFDEAVELVVALGKASASLLQRKLSIGYARAARLIDIMEEKRIIGPAVSGSKARDVLVRGDTPDIGLSSAVDEEIDSL
jgi:S-DNA-T family DNA segregation ATPase FtsK/SpoIIIE